MTKLPQALASITAPQQFISAMSEIWENDPNNLYEAWHNATKVAKALGLVKITNASWANDFFNTWQFPTGERVAVASNGAGIRLMRRIHFPHGPAQPNASANA